MKSMCPTNGMKMMSSSKDEDGVKMHKPKIKLPLTNKGKKKLMFMKGSGK